MNPSQTLADSVPVPAGRGNFLLRTVPAVLATWRQGPLSLTNLNAYAFGLSAVFTGVGSGVMPLLIAGLTDRGRIHFLWMDLDKNGGIAIVSLAGLIMAALIQPVAGFLSDRSRTAFGQRTPFMAFGALGLTGAILSLGFADTFLSMFAVTVALQAFGNLIQGPANALLIDHVPPARIGASAGLLNVYKVAGAGLFVVTLLLLMNNYDRETGQAWPWLWASLGLVLAVMLATVSWTISSLRPRKGRKPAPAFGQDEQVRRASSAGAPPEGRKTSALRGPYALFLVSLVFVVGAMSAMQVYSIPFLEDAAGLEQPALGAALLALVLAVSTVAVAVPAGRLQDRFGHKALLIAAGAFGGAGALLLLVASSLVQVMLIGVPVGISIGIFISVTWAMANGLVPKSRAARNLGYTSIATLVGAALARLAGPGIDALNANTPKLGYQVMLGAIALAFVIAPVLLTRVGTGPGGRISARQGHAVREGDR